MRRREYLLGEIDFPQTPSLRPPPFGRWAMGWVKLGLAAVRRLAGMTKEKMKNSIKIIELSTSLSVFFLDNPDNIVVWVTKQQEALQKG